MSWAQAFIQRLPWVTRLAGGELLFQLQEELTRVEASLATDSPPEISILLVRLLEVQDSLARAQGTLNGLREALAEEGDARGRRLRARAWLLEERRGRLSREDRRRLRQVPVKDALEAPVLAELSGLRQRWEVLATLITHLDQRHLFVEQAARASEAALRLLGTRGEPPRLRACAARLLRSLERPGLPSHPQARQRLFTAAGDHQEHPLVQIAALEAAVSLRAQEGLSVLEVLRPTVLPPLALRPHLPASHGLVRATGLQLAAAHGLWSLADAALEVPDPDPWVATVARQLQAEAGQKLAESSMRTHLLPAPAGRGLGEGSSTRMPEEVAPAPGPTGQPFPGVKAQNAASRLNGPDGGSLDHLTRPGLRLYIPQHIDYKSVYTANVATILALPVLGDVAQPALSSLLALSLGAALGSLARGAAENRQLSLARDRLGLVVGLHGLERGLVLRLGALFQGWGWRTAVWVSAPPAGLWLGLPGEPPRLEPLPGLGPLEIGRQVVVRAAASQAQVCLWQAGSFREDARMVGQRLEEEVFRSQLALGTDAREMPTTSGSFRDFPLEPTLIEAIPLAWLARLPGQPTALEVALVLQLLSWLNPNLEEALLGLLEEGGA